MRSRGIRSASSRRSVAPAPTRSTVSEWLVGASVLALVAVSLGGCATARTSAAPVECPTGADVEFVGELLGREARGSPVERRLELLETLERLVAASALCAAGG
ncbi:MAG: hypothetical protein CMF57_13065 [Leifsonia sp.]|nr:hypothetical protein [Leifsonia sp.]